MLDEKHLAFDDFSHLRCIMLRQTLRMAEMTRKNVEEERMKVFAAKDMNAYNALFRATNKKFHELQKTMVKEAVDHLKIQEELVDASQKFYLDNAETRAKLSKAEQMTRVEFFATVYPPCTETEEKVLEAAKF